MINSILREFNRDDGNYRIARIHVELARSIKMGPSDRSEYNKARAKREEKRSLAADAIRKESPQSKLSRELIDKYLLWEEQAGVCVYSGRTISLGHLLSGEVDVDHILPRWRSLDDSFGNTVVCFRDMNHEKGDRTPFEWLGGQPERFDAMKQRIRDLPFRKRARFTQEKLEADEFSARQLVDTAYITRAACDYLRCLVEKPHHVLGAKGTYTAELRHLWGLETVLSDLPDSPAWAGKNDLRPGEKNRADHRHHAVDAIVIAFTDESRLQMLSRLYRNGESGAEIEPWLQFRDSVVEAIKSINVSHRVQRKVAGPLHEETIYGSTYERTPLGERVRKPGRFVVRKPLESLTPAMVEDIRDLTIKKLVLQRLGEYGFTGGRKSGESIPKEVWAKPLLMDSGVPIRKVRIFKQDETICSLRPNVYVKPGSTHHLCIFEWTERGEKKRDAIFVSMLEAINRIKRREPIIQREHPHRPGAKFVMSLSRGELVLGAREDGKLMVFNTAASTQGQIYFHYHTDARPSTKKQRVAVKANSMSRKARKVTVDPLGRIRWAND